MDFLRLHGIPNPCIYGYSAMTDNLTGIEYIFMEYVRGTSLSDIWFDLSESSRSTLIRKLVQLERQLFLIRLPASGSLYYAKDVHDLPRKVHIPASTATLDTRFCIGPDMTLALWYGRRLGLQVDRGPYTDTLAASTAGAKKEIAYLKTYGRPLHPIQRLYREIYNYEKQSHLKHLDNLENYLKAASSIIPDDKEALARPTIRHPDLNPVNIFLSDDLDITAVIDWQHCAILPLFLQCGIPDSIQNYGDDISENLEIPKLSRDFDELSEDEQSHELELFRKRQLHYFYVQTTRKLNPLHYDALTHQFSGLRHKLFRHTSDPWEGDNITLKADLIQLTRCWSDIIHAGQRGSESENKICPINYSEEDARECLRLSEAQSQADEQYEICKQIIGVACEGWVPADRYDEARKREIKLKADALDAAESEEERETVSRNWIFDDFDESEYM
ncbi:hypothetical protein Plec18167_004478 [Paecilomyces lecythidis]|uniref:Aminoglycoside phosphotransferase domain-containing protein n=1 Tax=Paecilomyces lecythidis TaxID=3004212 RepID=A0ABR3XQZ4_9EURO